MSGSQSETIWACGHCHDGRLELSALNDHLGVCGTCGYCLPFASSATDGTTWREQAAMMEDRPGLPPVRPDRYRLVRPLARGAQGQIYLAHHLHLDQICVIKVIGAADEYRELADARLRAEARAGALVSHRNVARLIDFDHHEGAAYFVLEYVAGENVRELLRVVGRMSWTQAVEVGAQVAAGLEAIHAAGLVHRDIKPSNIMVRGDNTVKILDLGLVKQAEGDFTPDLTRDGQLLGTPNYMPPEQFKSGEAVTACSDVYGLGATLYHVLTGQPPFSAESVLALARRHRHDPVVWPNDVDDIPAWLKRVVETCLAKKPEHRFASAAAVEEALRSGATPSAPLLLSAPGSRPAGVAVLAFRNLSRREEDDWIGEAVADYLGNRLLEHGGLHVVDRHTLAGLQQRRQDPAPAGDAEMAEAARMLGVGTLIVGSIQRSGDQIRLAAHGLACDEGTASPRVRAHASGSVDDLFALEDRLAEQLLAAFGPPSREGEASEITSQPAPKVQEQFVKARRAFADGDYHTAIETAEALLEAEPGHVDAVSLIGACYARIGDYARALSFHQREETVARKEGNRRRLAEALGNIGVMYYYQGEYGLAFEFLQQASTLAREQDQMPDVAKFEGNLGFVLMRLNRYEEAEAAFESAIGVHRRFGDLVSLAWPYNGMGSVLLKQQRYAEAAEYYRRALTIAEEMGDRVNIGVGRMNLGRCACLMNDMAEAEACFDEALDVLQGTEFWNGLTLVYGYMTDMYLQEGNTVRALACSDKRLELAEKHGNRRLEAEAWEQRARAHELTGDTKEALRCLKRSVEASQKPVPHESLHRYLKEITDRTPFA